MLWVPVDRSLDIPLYRQIYNQIRSHTLNGTLRAGEKLPPTRTLASNLGVSRNVIMEAYDQLRAEGFIEGRPGAHTCVAEGAFLEEFLAPGLPRTDVPALTAASATEAAIIDFRYGIPLLSSFPRLLWERTSRRTILEAPDQAFGYGSPEGLPGLRKVLSRYLIKTRGLRCDPGQLIITTGATQAFTLIAGLLLSRQARVLVEDPVTGGVINIFQSSGCTILPVPVDSQGMRTDLLPDVNNPAAVVVTPSHQFPLGGTLPVQRRIQLIQFSRKYGCYIVEDDYDSEFRFSGNPVSSLQGLDPEKVIYVGTFSKILSPALRLGYLVLPHPLVERCRNLKRHSDFHTPTLDQITLAKLIENGLLERHIAKMRKVYKGLRDTLSASLENNFKGRVRLLGSPAGLHLTAEFRDIAFTKDLVEKALSHGVRIHPVEEHAIIKKRHLSRVIFGYGNLTAGQIEEGLGRLKAALR
ncbi:MAG: MocR-like pyridoxine biosynthesis transcription factor PdxR [Desulfocucumaceae bacterium]